MPAKCHEVDYQILGDDMQMVEIELDKGETVVAEAGAMNYLEDGIVFETKMGDGSKPESGFFGKLLDAGKRMISGTSVFLTHFTNQSDQKRKAAFSAAYPGKVIAVNLTQHNGTLLAQKNAFLCAALGTEITVAFTQKMGAGFFGGEGFILQKMIGDGMVFLHACGTILKRDLAPGEKLRVDTGCLVALAEGVKYDIEKAGSLKSMILGGEGLFLATLTGPGTVWIQSLPFSRMVDQIVAKIPKNTVSFGQSSD